MTTRAPLLLAIGLVAGCIGLAPPARAQANPPARLDAIQTVVVLYAENRSFDNLYGNFPGANGLANATDTIQIDRDGTPLKELPPVWGGLTGKGAFPPVTQASTEHLPNAPFAVDDAAEFHVPLGVVTHDLWHRFYENQMQIDRGRNDRFVAYADSGGLVMGHYDGSGLPLWPIARQYTLADNFFMGAFGGSFLNHIYLVCACAPVYPNADHSPAHPAISAVESDGVTLKLAADSPPSALGGVPKFVADGTLTPDFYAVNTMQPPYQPSAVKPAPGGDPAYADPNNANTLPPQTARTIGDELSAKGVSWAWYGGAWQAALEGRNADPVPNFQYHHQPFNYFAAYAPGTRARAEHVLDGGMDGSAFLTAIDAGALPQVAFYKPQGNFNEHAGYADVMAGDRHLADLVAHLQRSPQWAHMLVLITYDENGGWWDHAAPPKGDRWGPGTRIPALIISPYAKQGFVDHTPYDTDSVLRFITHRFALAELPGLAARDDALVAAGGQRMGDLTNALDLPR
ncbi:MAG: acid phosphatase [Acidisphaera sp.]|nr:acid phosphatase [Acidisphaera sp.]